MSSIAGNLGLGLAALALAGAPQKAKDESPALELFVNGDFEQGIAGWRTVVPSGSCRFEEDEKVKHSGERALRIERGDAAGRDFLKQHAALPGTEGAVRLRLAYKVAKPGRVSIQAYFDDAAGDFVGRGALRVAESGATRGFEECDETWEIPAGATGFGINVIVEVPGSVWLDAVRAEYAGPAARPEGELANASFDADLSGWTALAGNAESAVELACDRRTKAGGAASLCIARESPRLWPAGGAACAVRAAGLASVELAFEWRCEGAARAAVVLQALDAAQVALATERCELANEGAPNDFQRGRVALELPEGTASVLVELEAAGAGRAWFDELELEARARRGKGAR